MSDNDKLMPWHQTWLTDIEYDRVDLVKEGANSKAHIRLLKSKKGGTTMNFEEILKGMKPEHKTVIEEFIAKQKQDTEAKLQEAQQEIEKLKGEKEPAPGASEEEILKSIKDPAVRKLMETQIAKTKAAEEEVRKSREAESQREAIAKAKEVPNLGAEESQLAEVYKKLKHVDDQLAEDVFGIFKAANALIADGGAFTEVGKSAGAGEGGLSEGDAWAAIEAKAEEITKSTKMSHADAVTKVIKENPAMYAAYVKAQQG